jgi:hypothetical protein
MGGVGSGKTFGLLSKGIKYASQPKPPGELWGPRGTVAAATYGHLNDTILPAMEELVNQTGLAVWSRDYAKSGKTLHIPHNNGKILFRSLDDPDKVVRGPELSWIALDEGRNLDYYSWQLCVGRLRQRGYKWNASVASTPNGHDWMWRVFHPGSPDRWEGAEWYNAPTSENRHVPREYLKALAAGFSGRFYEQEVLGRFVGAIEGAVFPYFDPATHIVPLLYRPDLPLFSFWDFGYGDTGVCIFAQVEWKEKDRGLNLPGPKPKVPWLYILDALDAKEWTAKNWGEAYLGWLETRSEGGVKTAGDYGDPAGRARNLSTGSSVITDLNNAGVPVAPAAKRPQDYAIRILNNMMSDGRVLVSSDCNAKMGEAISHHHWKVDANGVKQGANAVHDWSSHFVDALRYGATQELSYFARYDGPGVERKDFAPDTYGYVFNQLLKPKSKRRYATFQPRAKES